MERWIDEVRPLWKKTKIKNPGDAYEFQKQKTAKVLMEKENGNGNERLGKMAKWQPPRFKIFLTRIMREDRRHDIIKLQLVSLCPLGIS